MTFITPEECAFASDLIKALESANAPGTFVSQQLRDLEALYQEKLQSGEIEKRRSNQGYLGKGHKFTAEEDDKIKRDRMELGKGFGYGVEEDGEENEEELQKVLQKRKEDQLKQEQYQLIQTIENDPIAKKTAMEAGHKASKEALIQGLS